MHAEIDAELRPSVEFYRDLPAWNGSSGGVGRPAIRLQADDMVRLTPTSSSTTVLGEYLARP